jgi:hypothetical protein
MDANFEIIIDGVITMLPLAGVTIYNEDGELVIHAIGGFEMRIKEEKLVQHNKDEHFDEFIHANGTVFRLDYSDSDN